MVLSHPHDEVEACHKGANGYPDNVRACSRNNIVSAWQAVKGDCGKINKGIVRVSQGLPVGSTRYSPSL
jgi:hypothetical protein